MKMPPFELHRPASLDELNSLLRSLLDSGEAFDLIAGGTDLLPNYKNRLNSKPHLVSLAEIDGICGLSANSLGAMAHISDLAENADLAEVFPGLAQAAKQIASPALRHQGTVGGNLLLDTRCHYFNQSKFWRQSKGYCMKADGDACLVVPQKETCYATYSGDLAPMMLVFDASLHFLGREGERVVSARDFYKPDGITRFDMQPGEILTRIDLPSESRELATGYRKLRARDSIEYPVMGIAMGMLVKDGVIVDLRVGVTGAESVPLYYGDLGLNGQSIDLETAGKVQESVLSKVKAYRNVPLGVSYRKTMAGAFARELFLRLV